MPDALKDNNPITSDKVVRNIAIVNGEKRAVISPDGINGLFSDINAYNDQFSMGATLGRSILGLFHDEDKDESEKFSQTNEQEKQAMTASLILAKHRNTLESLGLSLEPVSGKHATLFAMGEKIGEGEIRLNVSDRGQFLAFLHALPSEQVQGQVLGTNLEAMAGILSSQLLDSYNLDNPSDEALQLLSAMGGAVAEFRRLGLGNSQQVGMLNSYVDHINKRDLREYLAVIRQGLLSEPGKYFGPADWQTDSTPYRLAERWHNALQTLEKAKANPNAAELYQKLRSHLRTCMGVAQGFIKTTTYEDRDELGKVLEKASLRLKEFEGE